LSPDLAKGLGFNQRLNPVEPESADLVFAFAHLANEARLLTLGEQRLDDFDGVEIQTDQSLFTRLGGSVKNLDGLDGFRLGEQGLDVFDDVHYVSFSYLVTGKLYRGFLISSMGFFNFFFVFVLVSDLLGNSSKASVFNGLNVEFHCLHHVGVEFVKFN